eukprot:jgi/Psemu1/6686/gm1.6686_g
MSLDGQDGGVAFSNKLKVLLGTRRQELFLLWKCNFDRKITNNTKLNGAQKLDVLNHIVADEPLTLVLRTLERTQQADAAKKLFKNKLRTAKFVRIGEAGLDRDLPATTALSSYYKSDTFLDIVITGCMYSLKLKIFGNDLVRKWAYTNLQCYMRSAKVDLKHGIRSWDDQMQELQSYLPDCLWETDPMSGQAPVPFTEQEMTEILDTNLTNLQQTKLFDIDWDLFKKPYSNTIDKLESMETNI